MRKAASLKSAIDHKTIMLPWTDLPWINQSIKEIIYDDGDGSDHRVYICFVCYNTDLCVLKNENQELDQNITDDKWSDSL